MFRLHLILFILAGFSAVGSVMPCAAGAGCHSSLDHSVALESVRVLSGDILQQDLAHWRILAVHVTLPRKQYGVCDYS